MNDLVSILVPIYNVEKYIERCAVSLFEQTYQNIEYIFVDDCSPDNSIAVLRKVMERYPDRIMNVHVVRHQQNEGLAAARNTALEVAQGKYVMHVDSDDYLDVTTVEKAMKKMLGEAADVVVFGMNHVYRNKIVHDVVSVPSDPKEYMAKLIARECSVCVCGGLYLRSLYMDNNIRAIPGLNMGEDYATKPRLVYYARKIASLNEPLYNYVHYNEGAYSCNFKQQYIDNLLQAIHVLEDFCNTKGDSAYFADSVAKAKADIWFGLLTGWGMRHGSKDAWARLQSLFVSLPHVKVSAKKKVMIFLAQNNMPLLVKLYARFGVAIKKILK